MNSKVRRAKAGGIRTCISCHTEPLTHQKSFNVNQGRVQPGWYGTSIVPLQENPFPDYRNDLRLKTGSKNEALPTTSSNWILLSQSESTVWDLFFAKNLNGRVKTILRQTHSDNVASHGKPSLMTTTPELGAYGSAAQMILRLPKWCESGI